MREQFGIIKLELELRSLQAGSACKTSWSTKKHPQPNLSGITDVALHQCFLGISPMCAAARNVAILTAMITPIVQN